MYQKLHEANLILKTLPIYVIAAGAGAVTFKAATVASGDKGSLV